MPITALAWGDDLSGLGSFARDIHVLQGRATGTLLERLRVTASTPSGGTSITSASGYLADHNDVAFTFRPLFNGVQHANVYEGLGLHVDTSTGAVTVDASPPLPTRRNFIIEVEANNVGAAAGEFKERIRIQVHKSVKSVWLTPPKLTLRPRTTARPGQLQTGFVVRAQFDDDVIGDLTVGHETTWTPTTHVFTNGPLIVAVPDSPGDEFPITAQLAPQFGEVTPGTPWTATATLRIEKGWHDLTILERPELELVSGSAVPSPTNREVDIPNVLFVNDGWPAAAQGDFVRLTTELVSVLRKTKMLDPYPRLTDVICFWRMFVPSSAPTISILSEVYTFQQDGRLHARTIPPAERPPATGNFDLGELLYTVGLPLPGDATRTPADLRTYWSATARDFPSSRVSDAVIEQWKRVASRTFIDCVDSEFHMTVGDAPRANVRETHFLGMAEVFAGRSKLADAIAVAKSGVPLFGPSPAHDLWSIPPAIATTPRFPNVEYVVCFSTTPAGRALAVQPVVMTTRDDLAAWHVGPAAGHPGVVLLADEARLPQNLAPIGVTLAHELAHKFGLGDEYGEHKEKIPGAPGRPNLQADGDLRDPVTNRLRGQAISWTWHRIAYAALIEKPIVPSGSNFAIPVRPGHAAPFKTGHRVLLRQRQLRFPFFNPKPIVSSFEVEVDHTVSDDTVVVRLVGTATAAGLQAFAPGSIVFRPVEAPASIRDATYPFMQLIPKRIRDAITSDNKPLFTEGCDTDNLYGKQRPSLPGVGLLRCLKNTWRVIGLYEGGGMYTCGVYHPAGFCLMRNNTDNAAELCAVCRYILVDVIDPSVHALVEEAYADIYTVE